MLQIGEKAKHVSGNCTCSCAEAIGALVGESSLVEGLPSADETSLVAGPPSAATDAFFNAVMDQMKRISKKPTERAARVVRGMHANEGLWKWMQRAKKEFDA